MSDIILLWKEVELITGKSHSQAYEEMRYGSEIPFPKPIHLGKRSVGWLLSSILEWMEQRVAASDLQKSPEISERHNASIERIIANVILRSRHPGPIEQNSRRPKQEKAQGNQRESTENSGGNNTICDTANPPSLSLSLRDHVSAELQSTQRINPRAQSGATP